MTADLRREEIARIAAALCSAGIGHPHATTAAALDAAHAPDANRLHELGLRRSDAATARTLSPLQLEVESPPLCSRCQKPVATLDGLYRCAQCHDAFDLTCIREHFAWSVNERPHERSQDTATARIDVQRWIDSLHEDVHGLVWTTKAELRAVLSGETRTETVDA